MSDIPSVQMSDLRATTASDKPHSPVKWVFRFTGNQKALAVLSVKIALLTLLTLGIYRFWGKTRLRKYFWNNIEVAGDPLEYTGTPGELFKGFLIAIVVLAPVGMIYNSAATAAMSDGFAAQAWVEAGYYVALLILVQIAFYRMWRYRLSRTTWRGIRFNLTGSTLAYLGRSLIWTLAFFATAGLSYTWGRIALWRYRLQHTGFGSQNFSFDGAGRDLAGRWAMTFYIPICLAIAYALLDPGLADLGTKITTGGEITSVDAETLKRSIIILGLILLLSGFMLIWYRVAEFRYLVGNLEFGNVTFNLLLGSGAIIGLYFKLAVIVGMALFFAFVMAISAGGEILAGGIFIVTVFFLLPIGNTVIVHFGMAKAITEGLNVSDIGAFDTILQSVSDEPSTGEGLADALDVGAF